MYVGADSLVSLKRAETTNVVGTTTKLFVVSETCCASMENCYGGFIQNPAGGNPTLVFLPAELTRICKNDSAIQEPLAVKIERVVSNFTLPFRTYVSSVGCTNCETRVTFMGFDKDREEFFMWSYVFTGTNAPALNRVWAIGKGDAKGRFVAQGQESFFGTLFSLPPGGEDKLAALRTQQFVKTRNDIDDGLAVPEQEVVSWILEILNADEKWAIPLGFDDRPIGGPYLIVKITGEGMSQLR